MDKKKNRLKKWKLLSAAASIIVILSVSCVIYVSNYYRADGTALDALQSDGAVKVEWIKDNVAAFIPEETTAGLIFYPGGKVEYTAYAPLMHGLAE